MAPDIGRDAVHLRRVARDGDAAMRSNCARRSIFRHATRGASPWIATTRLPQQLRGLVLAAHRLRITEATARAVHPGRRARFGRRRQRLAARPRRLDRVDVQSDYAGLRRTRRLHSLDLSRAVPGGACRGPRHMACPTACGARRSMQRAGADVGHLVRASRRRAFAGASRRADQFGDEALGALVVEQPGEQSRAGPRGGADAAAQSHAGGDAVLDRRDTRVRRSAVASHSPVEPRSEHRADAGGPNRASIPGTRRATRSARWRATTARCSGA